MTNFKKDFPWFKNNPNITYLDSAATTLKPKCVIDAEMNYYTKYGTNPHNTDSVFSYKIYELIETNTRTKLAKFFNCDFNEVIYTSGATESLSLFANGLRKFINKNEEVLLTVHEHGSNIIPWLKLKKDFGIKVRFIKFNNKLPNEQEIIKSITNKTKVLSFASVSNLYGYHLDVAKISKAVRKINKNIIIVVDAAQDASHRKIDLKKWDIDFMAISAHKIYGPTGIGMAYINKKWSKKIDPIKLGGSMNNLVSLEDFTYATVPYKFEGGTLNNAGIAGWNAAIDYVNKIGINNIEKRLLSLKRYLQQKLLNIKDVIIYNKSVEGPILLFNIKGVNSQDFASYLGNKNIIVRSGLSCSKLVNISSNVNSYARVSLGIYNDTKDCDALIKAIKSYKKGDDLSHVI